MYVYFNIAGIYVWVVSGFLVYQMFVDMSTYHSISVNAHIKPLNTNFTWRLVESFNDYQYIGEDKAVNMFVEC
jgi:hypothetical protein